MATDQEIRDAGFKYIPRQEFLRNPFVLPTTDDDDDGGGSGGGGGGGGGNNFTVYNPDPNRTRNIDQYRPFNYRQANERNLIGSGDSQFDINKYGTGFRSETEAQKFMDMYPDYYRGKQLEGIPGAIEGYLRNSLPGRIIGGIGKFAKDYIFKGANRRAILENELLGQGFQLNDIGQFVSDGGNIYDPSGSNIMAGYNANKVTRQTFDKRRSKAKDKMSPEGFEKFNKALTAAEDKFFGGSGKATTVFNDKLKQIDIKDGFINDQISSYDEEDEIINPNTLRYITKKKAADAAGTTDTDAGTGTGTNNVVGSTVYANQNDPSSVSTSGLTYNQGGGPDGSYDFVEQNFGGGGNQGSYDTDTSTGGSRDHRTSSPGTSDQGYTDSGAYAGLARGGRVYFFDGGRVAVMNGGLVSLL